MPSACREAASERKYSRLRCSSAGAAVSWRHGRLSTIRNARIKHVGKYQACMVTKLRNVCTCLSTAEIVARYRTPRSTPYIHIIRNLVTMHA